MTHTIDLVANDKAEALAILAPYRPSTVAFVRAAGAGWVAGSNVYRVTVTDKPRTCGGEGDGEGRMCRSFEDIDGEMGCPECRTEATRALDHFLSGAPMKDFEG